MNEFILQRYKKPRILVSEEECYGRKFRQYEFQNCFVYSFDMVHNYYMPINL